MTFNVSQLSSTPEDLALWDAFVEACPEATFFHKAGWKQVVEKAFGHKTFYLKAESDGVIRGVLPLVQTNSLLFGKALISNGFCMGGGPAASDEEAREALDRAALGLLESTGSHYLEYRAPAQTHEAQTHAGWARRDNLYANFSRAIVEDETENLSQIPRKQRAVVRKAINNEALTEHLDQTPDTFHHLYAVSVRNLGTPVFAKKYFRALMEIFGKDCEVLTIRADGQPVSSVLSFYFRGTVMPYYTGSLPEARKLGSNDLMYWRLMRRAVARRCGRFDFGRSKIDTGPYAFKKNWGFTPEPIIHEYYLKPGHDMPNVNPTNPKYAPLIALWRRLPLPLANLIGPRIVRLIP